MGHLDLSRRAGVAAIVAAVCGAGVVTAFLSGSGSPTARTTTVVLAPVTSTGSTSRPATTSAPVAPPPTTTTTAVVPRLPDVTQRTLDQARTVIEDTGASVRVDGGGLFGVLDESAWTVCSSSPAAGTPLARVGTVTLHVERSCG